MLSKLVWMRQDSHQFVIYSMFFRCEPFDTYPRTYDLLHAAGLFSVERKRYNTLSLNSAIFICVSLGEFFLFLLVAFFPCSQKKLQVQ